MQAVWRGDELGCVRGGHGHQAQFSGGGGWGYMHLGVGPSVGGRCRGGSGGATRRRQGHPHFSPLVLVLAVPRMTSEVRRVAVRVSRGAPGRGGVGVVRHGNPGGRAGPPSRGRAGGGPGRGDRGGLSAQRGPAAHHLRHCGAWPAGYGAATKGCSGGEGTCPSGAGCTVAGA